MAVATSTIEKIKNVVQNRHQYAQDWQKKTGGKILGVFCTYVPEEIAYAAGVLPVRLLGSHEPQDVTEPYLFGMFCPFSRDVLAQGLKGRFNYLNGVAAAHTCMHINQSYESWSLHLPVERSFFVSMPSKIQTPRALPLLIGQLGLFKKDIEEWTGKKISDADLNRAIDVYNTNRRLMWEVFNLRKGANPPLTGLEAMYVALSQQMMDKEEHSQLLRELLEELKTRKLDRDPGARLMILGSEDDDTEFVKMVESVGATVVIDDHCTGTRYFWNEVERSGDIMESIAKRYIDRTPCPNRDWPDRIRFPRVLKMAKDFGVQGAIIIQQKFCDPHEADIPSLSTYLKKNGVPTLFLEFDVTVPVGQFRIRVEAFLETIGQEDLF